MSQAPSGGSAVLSILWGPGWHTSLCGDKGEGEVTLIFKEGLYIISPLMYHWPQLNHVILEENLSWGHRGSLSCALSRDTHILSSVTALKVLVGTEQLAQDL